MRQAQFDAVLEPGEAFLPVARRMQLRAWVSEPGKGAPHPRWLQIDHGDA